MKSPKVFLDSALLDDIKNSDPKVVSGFTTNPTLMKKAGVASYEAAARSMINHLSKKYPKTCLSLEVFADDFEEMYRQAKIISSWSSSYNVYVKIPITNTKSEPSVDLIERLSAEKVKVNVTAVFTSKQARKAADKLSNKTPSIISIFSGRIADAGCDPLLTTSRIVDVIRGRNEKTKVLWASPRQVYDYILAGKADCDIITMSPDLIKKLSLIGKDLDEYSLDTVKMFRKDAVEAGYTI